MKVRFTETRVADDWRKGTDAEERYEAGRVYDLPEASAQRWISRGACVAVPDAVSVAPPEVRKRTAPGRRKARPAMTRPKAMT